MSTNLLEMRFGPNSSSSVSSFDAAPVFLAVKPGDIVVIEEVIQNERGGEYHHWIGEILVCIGGARDPSVNSLFQITNIDTGYTKIVNADLVMEIIKTKK